MLSTLTSLKNELWKGIAMCLMSKYSSYACLQNIKSTELLPWSTPIGIDRTLMFFEYFTINSLVLDIVSLASIKVSGRI